MMKGPRRATGTIPPPEAVTAPTHDMTNDHPSDTPESGPKKRRFLSAEKKFQIYLEAQFEAGSQSGQAELATGVLEWIRHGFQ